MLGRVNETVAIPGPLVIKGQLAVSPTVDTTFTAPDIGLERQAAGVFAPTNGTHQGVGFMAFGFEAAIVAAGTTQGTAYALTYTYSEVATVGSGSGVILPGIPTGFSGGPEALAYTVFNNQGTNALKVYPPSGKQIDSLGNNVAYSLAAGKTQTFTFGPNGGYASDQSDINKNLPVQIDAQYGAIHSNTDGSTVTFDMSVSDKHTLTLTADGHTLATSNDQVGQVFQIILVQSGAGSFTVNWFSGIKWAGGSAPTLTLTSGKADIFTFEKTGSGAYYGFISGQNF